MLSDSNYNSKQNETDNISISDSNYNSKQNETNGKGLKILTPKQMLQRLPIALAEVKSSNNS